MLFISFEIILKFVVEIFVFDSKRFGVVLVDYVYRWCLFVDLFFDLYVVVVNVVDNNVAVVVVVDVGCEIVAVGAVCERVWFIVENVFHGRIELTTTK